MSWEKNVRRVVPYTAGEQPREKVIKLNTNEFPYAPSPKVAECMRALALNEEADLTSSLRKYPDMDATDLVSAISKVYDIPFENIFVGVGSDDVLSTAFITFFNSDTPVIFPDITYSFYDVWAELYNIPYSLKPLKADFTIDFNDYMCENGGIIIPNPNAPTGVFENISDIENMLSENSDSVVIIDEAYVDFGGESMLPLINKYDNLLVVQTFSKSRALAGLRIGMAFGSTKLIGYLKDVKFSINSYTMNYPSIMMGTAAVLDTEYFNETVKKVIKTRERIKPLLKEFGFSFPDSRANFIFASHEKMPAKEIFTCLRERGIYVRYWDKERINNYLRISIGTDEDMDALIKALKEILK